MRKQMKIAQVVCVFPPYEGGIGTVAANLSKYLTLLGHNVTVFTPNYRGAIASETHSDGYKIERLHSTIKFGNAAIMDGLIMRLKDFDIIDLHLPFIGTADLLIFAKISKTIKSKFVVHYHMDLLGKNILYRILFGIEQKCFIPLQLRLANKVIASSKNYLQTSKIGSIYRSNQEKFAIMPFGVDTKIFCPAERDANLSRKLGLDDKKTILFVGGLDSAHYFKGVNYLLEAFSMVLNKGYRLVIIGKGDLKTQYENQARSLGIGDRTVFVGAIPNHQLPKYYNLCDIFVLPSINSSEAFGIVLVEAMACGKPTVASNLPGVREVFGSYQQEISCEPMNPQDLANKIDKILSDDKLYKEISQKSLLRIRKEYSWETIASKLSDVYRKASGDDKY
jgi:glycosyltransferase involved in cell wall biosynthesis